METRMTPSLAKRIVLVSLALTGFARCETPRANDSQNTEPSLLPQSAQVPTLAPIAYATQSSPRLDSILRAEWAKSRIQGRLGFSVYSTRYRRTEASLNDTAWFTPASNLKLVVTAAALDTFPVNHFPVTAFEVRGTLVGRTLHGAVVAVGGGDPNVSNRFFPDALRPLKPMADSLKRLGIDSIIGSVITVDTLFKSPRRPKAWKHHHFNTWYGAEVASLSYQDNAFDLTIMPSAKVGAPPVVVVEPNVGYVIVVNKARTASGKGRRLFVRQDQDTTRITLTGTLGIKSGGMHMVLPVRNPAAYFRAAFVKAITQDSITLVADTSRTGALRADTLPLLHRFTLTTAPLYDMVEEVNQRSQNLQAEALLRLLGGFVYHDATDTSGIRAEYHFLNKIGVDTACFILRDGCGLSSESKIKPAGVAALLAAMTRHRYAADYIASLATPGLDGATGRRLRPWYQSNLLRFKTGSINRVQSLSGYAFGIDGDTLAVALFANDFSGSPEKASRLLDTLFVRVVEWANQEREAVIAAHKLMSRKEAPPLYRDRLHYFSAALEGKPYFLGPTGEGRFGSPDGKPLFDMSRFDCVTYMESVMGMALAPTARHVLGMVKRLRYRGDTLAFTTRNHYFVADWLINNAHYTRILPLPGDTTVNRTINKVKFFKDKGLPAPAQDPVLALRYLPYEKALAWSKVQAPGAGVTPSTHPLPAGIYGVAFVTDIAGLDITHCGFLISDGKSPMLLRHASQLANQVITMDFTGYLESRKGKCTGITVFELPNP
jgi:PBP4 family serine-type D-alanyl-D-alanine carboxypeptidase